MSVDTNPYPNLGFDPAPGLPADVAEVVTAVDAATRNIAETGQLLGTLCRSSNRVWKGRSGDAFRTHVDRSLIANLGQAQGSLSSASRVLREWQSSLSGFRSDAARLDQEMAAAKLSHEQAQVRLDGARSNSDLRLRGRQFSKEELPAIDQRIGKAEAAVTAAIGKVRDTEDAMAVILRRAHDLAEECDRVARRDAGLLSDAASHIRPEVLDSAAHLGPDLVRLLRTDPQFLIDHEKTLHDGLSKLGTLSAGLAVVLPPAEIVTQAGAIGNLVLDAYDPEIRKDVADVAGDAVRGHLDLRDLKEAWRVRNLISSDVVDAVPYVKTLRMAKAAESRFVVRQLDKIIPESALRKIGMIDKGASEAERFGAIERGVNTIKQTASFAKKVGHVFEGVFS